ncbi:AAA family ATPase [Lachnotalea glycerini]|uniref:Nuclease SbcCD subunit C n=1 Tax=Lachnotalea glycerini TaxID=1763509 RepID=A0A371JHT7_9FIRM|nr:AAA family ATPase [Lachnotalea glycerini]RDY32276.1 hypothetical protein CG710_004650 [Lachnotalea glycerini]
MEKKCYISKLYICNFKPFVYETKTDKPYFTIDFRNDKKTSSMILSGPNGYGKTSIFQSIFFALTGTLETGEYVYGNRKLQEHMIINDLTKCCFVAIEFWDEIERTITLVRYSDKGNLGVLKKIEEAKDFKTFIIDGEFDFDDLLENNYEEKTRKDIADIFGEKNILEWIGRNYIQQEHEGDLILKADKKRVDFLSKFIDNETIECYKEMDQRAINTKKDIDILEAEIDDIKKRMKEEVKDISGEEPKCEKVFKKIEFIWDKNLYVDTEPFKEYIEHAKHIKEILDKAKEYRELRNRDLVRNIRNNEAFYKYYILNSYSPNSLNKYMGLCEKKKYLQNLLLEGDILWKDEVQEQYLSKESIDSLHLIRENRNSYLNSLNDKQFLYEQVENFRKQIKGHEDEVSNIFENQCPLCGKNYNGNIISLSQSIQQAEKIFEESSKIIDDSLEKNKQVWQTDYLKFKKNIERELNDEETDEKIYIDINSKEKFSNQIEILKTELVELNELMTVSELEIFIDNIKFNEYYKNVHEYPDVLKSFKKVVDSIFEMIEKKLVNEDTEKQDINMLVYEENKNKITHILKEELMNDKLKEKIIYLEWKQKQKLAHEYSVNKKIFDEKIVKYKELCIKSKKLEKVLKTKNDARKEYLNDLMKYLEIPLYIYSGKLIQTHQSGLGVYCFTGQNDELLTEFKMSTDKKDINKRLDVSHKFSMGQKNITNIALMLALKKIVKTNLDVFMIDDPCQSLDELNMASFVEIIKNEFNKTQLILSTHEDKIASYIKYKNGKAGKDMIMYNVQEELYTFTE